MSQTGQQFDEVNVFEGVAERTGNTVDRKTVRGSKAVCSSVAELARKVRREGDGTYYVSSKAWPEDSERIDLIAKWTPMSG